MTVTALVSFLKVIQSDMVWADVKMEFKKPGFLNQVIDFDVNSISDKMIEYTQKQYFSKPGILCN